MPELILALDVGTTSARALVMDAGGAVLAAERLPIVSSFPAPGLVEQDAADVWRLAQAVIAGALAQAGRKPGDLAAVGVTTQRASVVVWDAATGEPAAPMVVWSDLRGLPRAETLQAAGFLAWPQTPACKLEAALATAGPGEKRWGTVDSYLVWRLTGGAAHVTDLSNAWLTGYLDFGTMAGWNAALLAHQGLSADLFPRIGDTWGDIGRTDSRVFAASVPITALVADQQAGMFAHDALARGGWKATYGTSAALMVSCGPMPESLDPSMPVFALAAAKGRPLFCCEGMVITAGAFLDWMAGLGLYADAAGLSSAAARAPDSGGAAILPALQGLGAPHGRLEAAALLANLRPGAGAGELARAALEGIAFRMREIEGVVAASNLPLARGLPVDGGMAASDPFCQIQADVLQRPLRRHAVRDATGYGAGVAAALGAGLIGEGDLSGLARYDATFAPKLSADEAAARFAAWKTVVGL
jgi:glycerol kinase